MEVTKEQLIKEGFTQSDVEKLEKILQRTENKNESFLSIIDGLSKAFKAFVIYIIFVFFIYIVMLASSKVNIIACTAVVIFAILASYLFTPVWLGWKAYKYKKK